MKKVKGVRDCNGINQPGSASRDPVFYLVLIDKKPESL
jgi:hypothetical protein